MNDEEFTKEDLNFIEESLINTQKRFREYTYDSAEIRKSQFDRVEQVLNKVRSLKKVT